MTTNKDHDSSPTAATTTTTTTTLNVAIFIYDDAEVLDFSGPFEVFSTASRVATKTNNAAQPFRVFLVAEHADRPVTARAGYRVLPDYGIFSSEMPTPIHVLLVVGGVHTRELTKRDTVLAWIAQVAAASESTQPHEVRIIASVCTGAFLLAEAGLFAAAAAAAATTTTTDDDNKSSSSSLTSQPRRVKVTTHWEDADELEARYGNVVEVYRNVRWIEDNGLITSGGISAGLDMALYLVSRLHSRDLAERTARQMDYAWQH